MKQRRRRQRLSHLLATTLLAMAVNAEAGNETVALLDDLHYVSIASGSPQPLSRAPAVASVITANDIQAMGARDLDQVLETVPGLHVATRRNIYAPIYTFRGIYSAMNPQVLVLVNGIPITNLFQGDRNMVWGGMPVEAISRIEVIRGPGSALYGADAYAGVINIITKNGTELGELHGGLRAGSFNSYDAWLQHGADWHGASVGLSMEWSHSDGQQEHIQADTQTLLDPSLSFAPGPVSTGRDQLELRLDLEKGPWRLRSGLQGRYDVGAGAGVAANLDPVGRAQSERFNTDLRYKRDDLARDWEWSWTASYLHTTQEIPERFLLFPPGAFGGTFPNGVLAAPQVYERHTGLETTALYYGRQGHQLRLGLGVKRSELLHADDNANFVMAANGALLPGSSTAPFVKEGRRDLVFGYIQDQWQYAPDWQLTAGVRHDHYSDFGATTNPRLALVWNTRYDLTTKLMYGRAFRAPSFAELYTINNPVQIGNPNLKPETIDTVELAWDYRPATDWSGRLNLFHYRMDDIIRWVQDPAPAVSSTPQNIGGQNGHGFELELEWEPRPRLHLWANYAWQRSKDETSGADPGYAPRQQVYLRAQWRLDPQWTTELQANHVADRKRPLGDNRAPLKDYTDLSLRLRRDLGDWEISATARNLLDQTIVEPSIEPVLVGDLPSAGRSLFVELRYDLH